MALSLFLFIYSVFLSLVCNFFTSGFVGCQLFCNQFIMFLAFCQSLQYVNVLFVQIEKKRSFDDQFIVVTWPSKSLIKNLETYCCKQQRTFFPELFSVDALMSVCYRQKFPSSQIELKLNSFSDSKARHCKNLNGLTNKICSEILQKVRPVTLIKNIFL